MDFSKYKRIVLKIGSAIVTDSDGKPRNEWLKSLSKDISAAFGEKTDVIIVTSGGVSLGRQFLKNSGSADLRLQEKQAAFACGQTELIKSYQEAFAPKAVGQILLTLRDTETRRNYLNAKSAIEELLKHEIIPVINENDIVATAELRYGDNDRLSARVAQMVGADLLILLSDVDGLYDKNPNTNSDATHISEIEEITREIEDMGGDAVTNLGSGGMKTKIDAAKIAVGAGCSCIITSGEEENTIRNLAKGNLKYSIFHSKVNPLSARKHWILAGVNPMGKITVDSGAEKALKGGSSLLPAGATKVEGEFERGDLVIVEDDKSEEIARGLVAYSSKASNLILGKQSSELEGILGYSGRDELIHRDDMVLNYDYGH